jgi:hypothetical protein
LLFPVNAANQLQRVLNFFFYKVVMTFSFAELLSGLR